MAIDPGNARALVALGEIRAGTVGPGGPPASMALPGAVMVAARGGSTADASQGGIVRAAGLPAGHPRASAVEAAVATSGVPSAPSAPPPAAGAFPAR